MTRPPMSGGPPEQAHPGRARPIGDRPESVLGDFSLTALLFGISLALVLIALL